MSNKNNKKFEAAIEFLIRKNPYVIGNRNQAINTLFCVAGTGLEWRDGEIKDEKFYYEKGIDGNYLYGDMSYKIPSLKELSKYVKNKGLINESEKYLKDKKEKIDSVINNVDTLKTHLDKEFAFYPMGENDSDKKLESFNICCIPNDVKKNWLYGAIECCDLIIKYNDKINIAIAERVLGEINDRFSKWYKIYRSRKLVGV